MIVLSICINGFKMKIKIRKNIHSCPIILKSEPKSNLNFWKKIMLNSLLNFILELWNENVFFSFLSNLKNGKSGILWQIMISKMGSKLLIQWLSNLFIFFSKVAFPIKVKHVERSYSGSVHINSFLPFFKSSIAELCQFYSISVFLNHNGEVEFGS